MALRTLLTARAGLESTRGAGATPTRLVYFEDGIHNQEIATIRPRERRASYFEAFRSYPGLERNSFEFGGDVTFDDLIWWANLHVKAVASGTGAGADKTWAFTPTASSDDLKSATLQWGYADGIGATRPAWAVDHVLGDELTLTWTKGDAVRFRSRLLSPKAASQISAFTGSPTDRTTISALGTATVVYIDAATIGTTADANIVEATFSLNNGLAHLDTLNGTNVAADLLRPEPRTWRLELTRYYGNDTERDAYVAKTLRKIRIQTTGPSLGGSAYRIRLDAYGIIDAIENADVDGLGTERITILPQYDSTAATDFSLEVVNATASIT
jgi:hypothetical protein